MPHSVCILRTIQLIFLIQIFPLITTSPKTSQKLQYLHTIPNIEYFFFCLTPHLLTRSHLRVLFLVGPLGQHFIWSGFKINFWQQFIIRHSPWAFWRAGKMTNAKMHPSSFDYSMCIYMCCEMRNPPRHGHRLDVCWWFSRHNIHPLLQPPPPIPPTCWLALISGHLGSFISSSFVRTARITVPFSTPGGSLFSPFWSSLSLSTYPSLYFLLFYSLIPYPRLLLSKSHPKKQGILDLRYPVLDIYMYMYF